MHCAATFLFDQTFLFCKYMGSLESSNFQIFELSNLDTASNRKHKYHPRPERAKAKFVVPPTNIHRLQHFLILQIFFINFAE